MEGIEDVMVYAYLCVTSLLLLYCNTGLGFALRYLCWQQKLVFKYYFKLKGEGKKEEIKWKEKDETLNSNWCVFLSLHHCSGMIYLSLIS